MNWTTSTIAAIYLPELFFFCFLMDGWSDCVSSLACTVMRTIMILDQRLVSLLLCLAVMTVSFI